MPMIFSVHAGEIRTNSLQILQFYCIKYQSEGPLELINKKYETEYDQLKKFQRENKDIPLSFIYHHNLHKMSYKCICPVQLKLCRTNLFKTTKPITHHKLLLFVYVLLPTLQKYSCFSPADPQDSGKSNRYTLRL